MNDDNDDDDSDEDGDGEDHEDDGDRSGHISHRAVGTCRRRCSNYFRYTGVRNEQSSVRN